MTRKLSAHYIFPVSSEPIRNGIIEVDDTGRILQIIRHENEIKELSGVEFYNGILVPGFVNTHCHLELSHLKNKVAQHTGLHEFVNYINKYRHTEQEIISKAIEKADFEMQKNGIVAVGDISNTDYSIFIKKKSKIYYHTFIEIFSLNKELANKKFAEGKLLGNKLNANNLPASIVPHAPYSLSKELFLLLKTEMQDKVFPVSMHNQESESENELFLEKKGKLFDTFSKWGIQFPEFFPTGKNSLESVIEYLPAKNNCILVHNTYSKKYDIEQANKQLENIYWSFCPNANLYIENRLPDISLFYREKQKCCIGTDSLASNTQLSILNELKTIQKYFKEIPITELIKWATLNGASSLNLQNQIGSFDIGKKPGINLITGIDYKNMFFSEHSKVKVLI